jgi:hypothetical protein
MARLFRRIEAGELVQWIAGAAGAARRRAGERQALDLLRVPQRQPISVIRAAASSAYSAML